MALLFEIAFEQSGVLNDNLLRVERVGRVHGGRLAAAFCKPYTNREVSAQVGPQEFVMPG